MPTWIVRYDLCCVCWDKIESAQWCVYKGEVYCKKHAPFEYIPPAIDFPENRERYFELKRQGKIGYEAHKNDNLPRVEDTDE